MEASCVSLSTARQMFHKRAHLVFKHLVSMPSRRDSTGEDTVLALQKLTAQELTPLKNLQPPDRL
jgi:hypothetical protein